MCIRDRNFIIPHQPNSTAFTHERDLLVDLPLTSVGLFLRSNHGAAGMRPAMHPRFKPPVFSCLRVGGGGGALGILGLVLLARCGGSAGVVVLVVLVVLVVF
eukprot:TRINITY_DN631_c0_g1_i1.p2 TRINITY_DN631_c0_g1~~TRINITY_DN631_c0_g1_i1.p2  ORF type:complete len:102 (+),score=10.86 TRINITY_DN631_c0_g1_i1:193-498(+)